MDKARRAWLCVGIWMVVIFLFSAQPGSESSASSGRVVAFVLWAVRLLFGESAARIVANSGINFIVRKASHFTEYAVLAVLLCHALRASGVQTCYTLALLFSALYACTDELHQYFVPGRSMQLRDVLIDTAGAAFGLTVVMAQRYLRTWRVKRAETG